MVSLVHEFWIDFAFWQMTKFVLSRSDFVYMVPPFLAYYGVTTANRSMLEEAYTQCKLYRSYLRDTVTPSGSKNSVTLWKHVVLGTSGNDDGHWSTGNGWAAMGMLRVLGTIKNSQYANSMKNEQKDLTSWVNEIQDGMYSFIVRLVFFRSSSINTSPIHLKAHNQPIHQLRR